MITSTAADQVNQRLQGAPCCLTYRSQNARHDAAPWHRGKQRHKPLAYAAAPAFCGPIL